MLSPNMEDFVEREKEIIGLSTLMNPQAFVKTIRPFFPGANIESPQLTYIRYKPFRKCLVKYQLIKEGKTFDIYAKAYNRYKVIKSKNGNDHQFTKSEIYQGKIALKDQHIVISIFPSDRNIKSLKNFYKLKNQRVLFKKLFPNRPELWEGRLQTLAYKPERRYVGGVKTKNGIEAVVKFYSPHRYPGAKSKALALKSQEHLHISKCLGWLDSENILGFEWLNGQTLTQLLKEDPKTSLQAIKNTGIALAKFHSQHVKNLDSQSRKDESIELLNRADYLGFFCLNISNRAKKLARFLASKLVLEPTIKHLIHNNLNTRNVIVNNGQVGFIDFDAAILGDPRTDLGSLIASLQYMSILGEISENHLQELKETFLNSYHTTTVRGQLDNLDLFIAVGLFQRVINPFRNFEPDWKTKSERILDTIELITKNHFSIDLKDLEADSIHDTEGCIAVPSHPPLRIHQNPYLPFLSDSLNTQKMELHLTKLMEIQNNGMIKAKLRPIKEVRYKPRSRCLIEYEVELLKNDKVKECVTLLGKMHRGGLDKTSYNLHKFLWKAGFDSNSSDYISVPQAIGMIPKVQIWLQKKVEGVPAINLLVKKDTEKISEKIAEAIHKVHQVNIFTNKTHCIEDELLILNERLDEVSEMNPLLKNRIDKLIESCRDLAGYLPEREPVGIHRDFYHDQVIVDGKRIHLVDFDLYCKGDPALDVGNFIGHLQEFALRKFGNPNALGRQEKALVNRFIELTDESMRKSVEIYTALTLARHVSISQKYSDRYQFTEKILSLCEKRIQDLLLKYKIEHA